jgi:sarcosine oxidase, subunit gamma
MSELLNTSPLQHREAPEDLGVMMREITGRGMVDLRGLASDRKFLAATKKALGFDLPKEPRTSASWGDMKALWLSIDQWLILCPLSKAEETLAKLKAELSDVHSLAADVSAMRAIIRVEGEAARTTLLKGTSLDLLGGDYQAGTVRRMRFAEIAAVLHVVERDVFDIYVFRSYADYTWDFLCATAKPAATIRLFDSQSISERALTNT